MPLLEKELSDALVHYRYEAHQGVQTVPVEKVKTLLRKWYEREHEVDKTDPILASIGELQAQASRMSGDPAIDSHIAALQGWLNREMRRRWAEEEQVLEGTDEFNRGHKVASG